MWCDSSQGGPMSERRLGGCGGGDQANASSARDRGSTHRRALVWLLAIALVALGTAAASAARHKRASAAAPKSASPAAPAAQPTSSTASAKPAPVHRKKVTAAARKKRKAEREKAETKRPGHVIKPIAEDAGTPVPPAPSTAKQAISLIRKGQTKEATELAGSIDDPVAAKLVQWARLRHADSQAGFDRYAAFISANPDWPSISFRRRAEVRLWQERRDAETVRRF